MGGTRSRVALVTLLAVALSGSEQTKTPRANQAASQPQKDVAKLESEVSALRTRVDSMEQDITSLYDRAFSLETAVEAYKRVNLDLTSLKKYQRIDSNVGSFLVSVDDATPYLDGYRITMRIGNPSTATYSGFSLKVRWAKRFDWSKFKPALYTDWRKSIREKEISFTDALLPGTWNKIEVILSSVAADQLGFFEVSLSTDLVSLRYQ